MSRQGVLEDERGFTLVEVLVVIIMMGIVFAIASASWFGVAESRRVDSATNQVVADLRLAHSQATNRLVDSSFIIPSANSTTYQVGPADSLETRTLPGDDQGTPKTKIIVDAAPTTIAFKADGGAQITPPPPGNITLTVAALDNNPSHTIQVNTVTSRIQVDP
jgi:prepilin-type N-terminal cleavage/methylation domain-containing protein